MVILPVPRSLRGLCSWRRVREGPLRYMFLSEIIKLCAGRFSRLHNQRGAMLFASRATATSTSTKRKPKIC